MSIACEAVSCVGGRTEKEYCTQDDAFQSRKAFFDFISISSPSLTISSVLAVAKGPNDERSREFSHDDDNNKSKPRIQSIMDSTLRWCDKFYLLWSLLLQFHEQLMLLCAKREAEKSAQWKSFQASISTTKAINKCVSCFRSLFSLLCLGSWKLLFVCGELREIPLVWDCGGTEINLYGERWAELMCVRRARLRLRPKTGHADSEMRWNKAMRWEGILTEISEIVVYRSSH